MVLTKVLGALGKGINHDKKKVGTETEVIVLGVVGNEINAHGKKVGI